MKQTVTPFLWFDGQAAAAAKFYVSVFKGKGRNAPKVLDVNPMSATFRIGGIEFMALNGGPLYKFTPAISFFVSCKTQKEVDYFWNKLGKGGKIMQCGWVTDKFGVTWQIIPEILGSLLGDPNEVKAGRAMKAMLKMKKLDIAALQKAHSGR